MEVVQNQGLLLFGTEVSFVSVGDQEHHAANFNNLPNTDQFVF